MYSVVVGVLTPAALVGWGVCMWHDGVGLVVLCVYNRISPRAAVVLAVQSIRVEVSVADGCLYRCVVGHRALHVNA